MWVRKSSNVVWKSLVDFFKDDGLMLAGSMSFFFMMALIPYCLFLFAIFGYFLGAHAGFSQFFLEKLISLFPKVTHVITEELTKIIIYKEIGNVTLFLYGVLSFQLFSSLDVAINRIFGIHGKRPFIVSVVFSLTVITFMIALFLVSFSASSAVAGLETLKRFIPALRIGKLIPDLIPRSSRRTESTISNMFWIVRSSRTMTKCELLGKLFIPERPQCGIISTTRTAPIPVHVSPLLPCTHCSESFTDSVQKGVFLESSKAPQTKTCQAGCIKDSQT